MSLVQIDWSPDTKKLREFGIAMIVGFAIIGALAHFGVWPFPEPHPAAALGCWIFGALSGVLGLTGTPLALPIYWVWMGIAFVMGNIVSRVMLVLVYYLVFTPMGLLGRLIGRDRLELNTPKSTESYWVPVEYGTDRKRYRRQF